MAEELQGSVSSFNFWSSLRCSSDIFSCSTALNAAGDIEDTFGYFPASNEISELNKANSFDYFTQPSSLDPLSSSLDWSQSFLESSETDLQAVPLEGTATTRDREILMDFTETSSKDFICQSNQTVLESAMAEIQILPTVEFPSNGSLFSSTSVITNPTAKLNAAASRDPTPPIAKKIRLETPSPLPAFKVRKEKLGDRITALQQLVSPFGKTDTASVLHEAIEYIKYLHQQVNGLSNPYLINGQHKTKQQEKNGDWAKKDLRSLGLCLVPISTTFTVACNELPPDFWTQLWSMENYYSIRRER